MLILIEKDSATRIPKDVSEEEAAVFAEQFPVFVVNDDASTTPYSEWLAENQTTEDADQLEAAKAAAFAKSGLSKSKWNKLPKAERDALIQAEMA